jgi:hypothetical protein
LSFESDRDTIPARGGSWSLEVLGFRQAPGVPRALKSHTHPADDLRMNVYDVNHVSGDIYEIEADFYERQRDEWVFYAAGTEVFRVSWFDVLGVAKSTLREPPAAVHTADSATIWLQPSGD